MRHCTLAYGKTHPRDKWLLSLNCTRSLIGRDIVTGRHVTVYSVTVLYPVCYAQNIRLQPYTTTMSLKINSYLITPWQVDPELIILKQTKIMHE